MSTLTYVPRQLTAGDSFSFLKADPAYSSNDYSLKFSIATPTPVIVDAQADHTVTGVVPDGTTPGIYAYAYIFTALVGGGRTTVPKGSIQVLASALLPPVKSNAQATLEKIDATLLALADNQNSTVTINGEQFTVASIPALRVWRAELIAEVAAEQTRAGMKPVRGGAKKIQTRFSS